MLQPQSPARPPMLSMHASRERVGHCQFSCSGKASHQAGLGMTSLGIVSILLLCIGDAQPAAATGCSPNPCKNQGTHSSTVPSTVQALQSLHSSWLLVFNRMRVVFTVDACVMWRTHAHACTPHTSTEIVCASLVQPMAELHSCYTCTACCVLLACKPCAVTKPVACTTTPLNGCRNLQTVVCHAAARQILSQGWDICMHGSHVAMRLACTLYTHLLMTFLCVHLKGTCSIVEQGAGKEEFLEDDYVQSSDDIECECTARFNGRRCEVAVTPTVTTVTTVTATATQL